MMSPRKPSGATGKRTSAASALAKSGKSVASGRTVRKDATTGRIAGKASTKTAATGLKKPLPAGGRITVAGVTVGTVEAGSGTGKTISLSRGRLAKQLAYVLAREASPEELRILLAAAEGDAPDEQDLDPELWGAAPTTAEGARAEMENLRQQFAARQAVADASLDRTETAEMLGTSAQTVTDYLEARRLLGIRRGRRWLIPAWQLEPDSERGILPGLADLAAAFPGGLVALTQWAQRSSPDLDGRTPRAALARGDVETVVRTAKSLTSAAW